MNDDDQGPAAEPVAANAALEARVTELEHDLAALASLIGHQVGEPFRSQAAEIIAKRQTGG